MVSSVLAAAGVDIEVLSEGWDETTAGGHIHGLGDDAMGWSAYSESLRISYANPALVALQPTENTQRLLRRLASSPSGLDAAALTEELFAPSFAGALTVPGLPDMPALDS